MKIIEAIKDWFYDLKLLLKAWVGAMKNVWENREGISKRPLKDTFYNAFLGQYTDDKGRKAVKGSRKAR